MPEPLKPWLAQAADEQKGNEYLGTFETITDANRAHLEMVDKVKTLEEQTKGMVKIPGDGATEDERLAYRKARGVPEKPEDYKFDEQTVPDGMVVDKEMEKWFKQIAHQLEYTQAQANTMYQEYSKRQIQSHYNRFEANAKAKAEAVAQMKALWGEKYEANMKQTEKAIVKFGSPEFLTYLKETGLGNNPDMAKFLLAVSNAMGEDELPGGGGPGDDGIPVVAGQPTYNKSPKLYKNQGV